MIFSWFTISCLKTCMDESMNGSNVAILSSNRDSYVVGFQLISKGYNVTFGEISHAKYLLVYDNRCPINYVETDPLVDIISYNSEKISLTEEEFLYFIFSILILLLIYIYKRKFKQVIYHVKNFKFELTNKTINNIDLLNGPYKIYDEDFSYFKSRAYIPVSKNTTAIIKWKTKIMSLSTIGQFEIPFACYFMTDEQEKLQEFPAVIRTSSVPGTCILNVVDSQVTCRPRVEPEVLHCFSKSASSIYLIIGTLSAKFIRCSSIEDLRNLFMTVSNVINVQSSMLILITPCESKLIYISGTDKERECLMHIISHVTPPEGTPFIDGSITLEDKRVWGGGYRVADCVVVTAFLRHCQTSVIRGPEKTMTQLLSLFFAGVSEQFIRSPAKRFTEYKDWMIEHRSPEDIQLINYGKKIVKESIGTIFDTRKQPMYSFFSDHSSRLIRLIPPAIIERRRNCILHAGYLKYLVCFIGEKYGFIIQLGYENDFFKFTATFGVDCLLWVINQRNTKQTLFSSIGIEFDKFVEKLTPGDANNVEAAVKHVLEHKDSSLSADFHYNGRHYSVSIACTCSDLLRVVAISTDDRSKREREVREIEKSVSIALSTGRVSIWSYEDTENPVRVYSQWPDPRATSIANKTTIMFNIPMEYQESVFASFKTCISDKRAFSIDVPVMMNTVRWFSIRGIRSGPSSILLLMIDITATKNAEEHLRIEKSRFVEAATAKTKFLANMSHEIRNPLNGMSGLLELLMSTDVVEKYSDNCEILSDSFQNLIELLNDILDLAKIEQNQMHPSFTDFDPLQVLSDCLAKPVKQCNKNGIAFNPVVDPKLAYVVHGDPHIFARVASNLVSNAVKFTKRGSITITLQSDQEDNLKLSVQDTGIGISHDFQQKIFGIFLQGDNSITRSFGGIGVGLALVNKMLQLINGRITLKSNVGRGSAFNVTFPYQSQFLPYIPQTLKNKTHHQVLNLAGPRVYSVCQPHCEFFGHELINEIDLVNDHLSLILIDSTEQCIEQAKELIKKYPDAQAAVVSGHDLSQDVIPGVINVKGWIRDLPRMFSDIIWRRKKIKKKQSRGGLKVLLAEDNPTNQLFMRKVFEKLSTEATIVDNGADALKKLSTSRFDLVILDQHMPVMDGPSCAMAIRSSNEIWSKIPIIALTASHSKEDENACLSAGMDSFLTKPVTIRMIQSLLDKYELI